MQRQTQVETMRNKVRTRHRKNSTDGTRLSFDVLILGCGAAGLSLALRLPETCSIAMLAKDELDQSSTYLAQGGISAVISDEDSIESHIEDTIAAGAGLCSRKIVEAVVKRGPDAIRWLLDMGVSFTLRDDDPKRALHLTREGGHSRRRVVHSRDKTGEAVQTGLLDRVRERKNIKIIKNAIAVNLITARTEKSGNTCVGAYVLHRREHQIIIITAKATVLATGGAGKVYLYTSNPDSASGDGIAMAWHAGCRIANMEFMQFHPTCLYHSKAKSFLLSESLRGEGARLLLPDGSRFMQRMDPEAELAPRDVVARAIDHEMKRLGINYVLLDISHKPKTFLLKRFPSIYRRCLEFGYDMAEQPVPVVPAMHYTCGGVMVDGEGRTDVAGLYAVGEVSHTGLHGANRMASNSLLECLVFAQFAAQSIDCRLSGLSLHTDPANWDESRITEAKERIMVSHNWHELRRIMWNYVGIVRTRQRLLRAQQRIKVISTEIEDYYRHHRISDDLIELRNLAVVATLIITSALSRHESRGLHYTGDHPETNPALDGVNTILTPPRFSAPNYRAV